MTRLAILAAFLALWISSAGTAYAGTQDFTDSNSFASATTSPATIGFNNILPSGTTFEGFNPFQLLGITFSTTTPDTLVNVTAPTYYSPNIYPAPFIVDSVNSSSNNELTISFSKPTFAVALNYGGLGFSGIGSGTFTLSNGHVFEVANIPHVGHTAFIGFVSTEPITSIRFVTTNDHWVVQNLVLAEVSCGPSASFTKIVQNGVTPPRADSGTMSADFKPGCGMTLDQAAQLGGYDHFNWVQVITQHDGLAACEASDRFWPEYIGQILPCFEASGLRTSSSALPSVPFFDVPPGDLNIKWRIV
jgi:hypothetical protein